MRFVETPIFTRMVRDLMPDDQYRELQLALLLRPDQGSVIPGSGGLRKLRWGSGVRGKRGGVRVIYFWDLATETFYMLYGFGKNQQSDLTRDQLQILRRLVREEFK
jgi:hypothetical protein